MTRTTGYVEGAPLAILKAEGLAVLLLAVSVYGMNDWSWKAYFLFLLLPDLGILGYLLSPKVGCVTYNVTHSYVGPLFLAFWATAGISGLLKPGLIWASHIGLDRMLGLGLKYSTAFRETHLGVAGPGEGE